MEFDCDKCIHRSNAEKFMYCKECSTCTNGETDDTDNHFMPKDFTQDSCIMYLQANGWLDNHDKEIEIKAITKCMDLVRDVMVDLDCVNATKYGNKNAKQQENSYSTVMRYEIADELDSLLDWMEQLKEQNEIRQM